MNGRSPNVALVPQPDGFAFTCLRCGFNDGKVMRTDYAAWGRFGGHVRVVHGPLRRRRRQGAGR